VERGQEAKDKREELGFELLKVMLPEIESPALGYLSMCLIWVAK